MNWQANAARRGPEAGGCIGCVVPCGVLIAGVFLAIAIIGFFGSHAVWRVLHAL